MAQLGYRVELGDEFRRVATSLRAVDGQMPTKLRKEMQDAVKPAVAQVKANARGIPVAGRSGSSGLRRRVASGVRIQAGVGNRASLRVITSMPEEDEAVIPGAMDSPRGWRHPVFGHRDRWTTQHTGGSWFKDTMAASDDEIQQRLQQVLERAAQTVAAAGGG